MEGFSVKVTLKIGGYVIFFWSYENQPLEAVHIHISEGKPSHDSTKLWITSAGKIIMSDNKSMIPDKILWRITRVIETNSEEIIEAWIDSFGEIRYFC